MKPLYYIALFALLFVFAQETFAQDEQPGRRGRTRGTDATGQQQSGLPDLTERARIKNSIPLSSPETAVWLREIYRSLDLEQESNAALYYPVQPIGKRMNLFTLLFRLLNDGKIKAYTYEDGREVFTDDLAIDFKEMLDKYQIYYTIEGAGDNVRYKIDDMDIPGNEVTRYMIKEAYYVDEATGTYHSQVIALCPLLVRVDYYTGATQSNPLFWVSYEEIRPYLSRELIMTSNYNNALTYTMDDYFTKQMYSGEIIKTTNLMNLTLEQQVSRQMEQIAFEQADAMGGATEYYDGEDLENAEAMAMAETPVAEEELVLMIAEGDSIAKPLTREDFLKLAQDSIEHQLKAFNEGLWVYSDSIAKRQAEEAEQAKGKKKSKKEKSEKESKPKESNKSSEKTTPTRSVRRGR
jgi:gliding motility associated protien GldN